MSEQRASLTHLDEEGRARMVDVGWKPTTDREATAKGHVSVQPETLRLIKEGLMKKGDVLTIAQLGGIRGVGQHVAHRPASWNNGRQTHLGLGPPMPSPAAKSSSG